MQSENENKSKLQDIILQLLYINEQVFELQIEKKDLDKLQEFKSKLPGAILEFQMWLGTFYKKIDEKILKPI